MLFDPRPKTSLNEVFDREKEIGLLKSSLNLKTPLITVHGLRSNVVIYYYFLKKLNKH